MSCVLALSIIWVSFFLVERRNAFVINSRRLYKEFHMRFSMKSKYCMINSDEFDDGFELVLNRLAVKRVDEHKYLSFNIQITKDE